MDEVLARSGSSRVWNRMPPRRSPRTSRPRRPQGRDHLLRGRARRQPLHRAEREGEGRPPGRRRPAEHARRDGPVRPGWRAVHLRPGPAYRDRGRSHRREAGPPAPDGAAALDQQPPRDRRAAAARAGRRLRRTNDALADLIFTDVPGRVAKNLLQMAGRFGTREGGALRVTHDLTQEELAQLVGASRETVNKALADFASRGWLGSTARASSSWTRSGWLGALGSEVVPRPVSLLWPGCRWPFGRGPGRGGYSRAVPGRKGRAPYGFAREQPPRPDPPWRPFTPVPGRGTQFIG